MNRYLSIILLWFFMAGTVNAETILMARSHEKYSVVIDKTKKTLEGHGYTVSHEQRCDGGLKKFGYNTDTYRVLFFGKPEEVRYLSKTYPALIPYLPLKLAVYAEGDDILVASFNPEAYSLFFPQKELKIQFSRWKSDLDSIFKEIRR